MFEVQEALIKLIEYAQANKHTDYNFIRSWAEYRTLRKTRNAMKFILKQFEKGSKDLFKTYCTDVTNGSADVNKLLAIKQFKEVIEFYIKEYEIISDRVHEYEAYLLEDGNLLWAFLGSVRSDEDLTDFRI